MIAKLVSSWKHRGVALLAAVVLAGCSSGGIPAPVVRDTWRPPEGAEALTPASCDENRDLFAYDVQAPLDAQEISRSREESVTVIDLTYASPMGGRVPATLVVPDGAGPFAGMLYQHGMPSTRQPLIPGAVTYARMGAIVLLIDAPFARRPNGLDEALTFTEQDRREQIQLIIDLRRGIDLLLNRSDVDPDRLAYVGISYGGAMGGLLAGVEDRLKAYVLQVGDGGLVTHMTGPEDAEWWLAQPADVRQAWVAAMWPIEPIHYVGCAAPADLLFQNGTLDRLVPPADALRYQQAGSEPKTIRWYEAGHGLPAAAGRDQAAWLGRTIGISMHRLIPPTAARLLLGWAILTVGSLAFMGWQLRRGGRAERAPHGASLLWLLTTAFFGPFVLAICAITGRQPRAAAGNAEAASPARRALGSAAWAAAGTVTGGIVVLWLLINFEQVFARYLILQLTVVFLVPFSIGGMIFAVARWISRSQPDFAEAHRRPVLAEMASTCLVLAGVYPMVNTLIQRALSPWTVPFGFDILYPPLWGALCLGALAGGLVAYPYHLWMIRRGVIRWGNAPPSADAKGLVWYVQAGLFALAFGAMLAAVVLSMQLS